MWATRDLADEFGASVFLDNCSAHGRVAHLAASGLCLACFPTPVMKAADCPQHGISVFFRHARHGRCCFTTTGRRRGPTGFFGCASKRKDAAKAGKIYFVENCLIHGFVDHYVIGGQCSKCFTARGRPRRTPALGWKL